MKRSIKQLRIYNFLSFKSAKLDLTKLNLFVGFNASGKSNIVKALFLLSRLMQKRVEEIYKDLGITQPLSIVYGFRRNVRPRLSVVLGVDNSDLLYQVEFAHDGKIFSERIEFDKKILLNRTSEQVEIILESQEKSLESVKSAFTSVLLDLPLKVHPMITLVRDTLKSFQTYSFDPEVIRSYANPGFKLELSSRGENLAQVLHAILTSNRKRFAEIEGIISDLITEIEEINVPTTEGGDRVYIAIKEKDLSELIDHANISDGTLRILAFLTALCLGGSLVAFEEPENCVHPYLFETMIDLCRKTPSQVMITTHSPYLVDKVELDELYLVQKVKGESIVGRVKQKEKVKKMLKNGLLLGEVWFSGELSGAT
jgi:AAA15 family ATPase/GTPase